MSSTLTGRVESWPCTTMPSESPTSTMSTPAASNTRAKPASYAVSIASLRPASLASASCGTVTGFSGGAGCVMALGYRFDAGGIQLRQGGGHGAVAGDARPGRDLRQRHQGESAFVQVGVRHLQPGGVDHRLPVQQQVQVQGARAPARAVAARAAETPLD